MNAFAKGAPLRAIGNASTGSSEYWYVPGNSPLQGMKGAAGKTIAYSTIGASSHLEVLSFLKYYGLDAKPIGTGGTAATFIQVMSGAGGRGLVVGRRSASMRRRPARSASSPAAAICPISAIRPSV